MDKSLILDYKTIKDFSINRILNKVFLGDCLKVMEEMPKESVDMIFVDPPYNLQLPEKKLIRWSGSRVEGVNDKWDKFEEFSDYDNFTVAWLKGVKRIMKPKATLWVIGTYHNIHRVGSLMHDLGFWILNEVIWYKTNPMPNFLGVRFTNATETLIWAVKDKNVKGYTFNKDVAKRLGDNGKLAVNVWRVPLATGKERLKDKEGKKLHSTQKPEALLERVVLTSTKKGDIVFDPMAGTGTTGFVAKKHGRNFIMVEIEKGYVKAIEERFKHFNQLSMHKEDFSVV